jgi:hypothetical protein
MPWMQPSYTGLNLGMKSSVSCYRRGKRIATERRNREIFWDLFSRVCDLHKAGDSIGEELFEKVGKEFGVGKTVASEIYYETGRAFIEELEEDKALDRKVSEENKK